MCRLPLLGHGLVGLGIGVATTPDVRGPRLRAIWLGAVISLAYLPDLLEWVIGLAGIRLPHSALAALPVTAASGLVVVLLLRLGWRERNWIVLAAALCAVASHMLLDLIDGGIPLYWPLTGAMIGPDWFDGEARGGAEGLIWELFWFAPLAAVGATVAICRRRPGSLVVCAALILPELLLAGAFMEQPVLTAVAGGILVVLALRVYRWRPRWGVIWQIVPVVPVMLLAAVQGYATQQMRLGRECFGARDYASARQHFTNCANARPLGLASSARYEIARCCVRLGEEETAHGMYLRYLEEDPAGYGPLRGLTELYLTARDERFRRPAEALYLAERLVPAARDPAERELAQRLLDRARRAADHQE
ncbi:MAG: hypothetical protein ABIG44_03410 [Planctomycetota bacterium]